MIFSDSYRFVFVHIPKCAGTYIRARLKAYDDTGNCFFNRVERHPTLGMLDYQHIPLHALQQHFPSEFERVKTYSSFAVLRDPFDRFPSSLAQRLRERGISFHTLSRIELQREIEAAINYLSQNYEITNPAYIHLARQSDYVELRGERIVHNLYSVGNVDSLLRKISQLTGTKLVGMESVSALNQTDVYRNEGLRRTLETLRPILGGAILSILPDRVKRGFRKVLYMPSKQNMPKVFQAAVIRSFVREYYRRDFEMHESIASNDE